MQESTGPGAVVTLAAAPISVFVLLEVSILAGLTHPYLSGVCPTWCWLCCSRPRPFPPWLLCPGCRPPQSQVCAFLTRFAIYSGSLADKWAQVARLRVMFQKTFPEIMN